MKTGRFIALVAGLFLLAGLLPRDASAIPVFARKYNFNCTMCHSAYPRLNDFGARFRVNGYRLPGFENTEKTILESPPPVAFRPAAGYTFEEFKHAEPGDTYLKQNGFQLSGLDVLSAGLLGMKIGYFMVLVPGITEARGVAGQEASLEMASVVFSRIAKTSLAVRVGRFEPAYTAFSVKRHLGFSPYEVYEYAFPGGPPVSETQTGIEVTGGGFGPLRAAAGLVAGSATNLPEDAPRDAYVRLEGIVGPGEGQTAGQRIGLVGYLGRARPDPSVHAASAGSESFGRLGADASLNYLDWNLALQFLWARDDGSLWGRDRKTSWSGGFAELTWTSPFNAAAFARLDLVQEPAFIDRDIRRITGGCRYYFEDNVALHLEVSHQAAVNPVNADPIQNFVTMRVDVAF
jgi:hypothetical protein